MLYSISFNKCAFVLFIVEEATRAWKILSNPQTALVRKRQIMNSMFGDYRAKMAQEEKQYSISMFYSYLL